MKLIPEITHPELSQLVFREAFSLCFEFGLLCLWAIVGFRTK